MRSPTITVSLNPPKAPSMNTRRAPSKPAPKYEDDFEEQLEKEGLILKIRKLSAKTPAEAHKYAAELRKHERMIETLKDFGFIYENRSGVIYRTTGTISAK